MTIQPDLFDRKPTLTQERLKELLHYDPETGAFTRLVSPHRPDLIGESAGTLCRGYVAIYINGSIYRAHRLAWLYMTGNFPRHEIDHINNRRSDNRWKNLRLATRHQNARNSLKRSDNKSGIVGVHFDRGKWRAYIYFRGRRIHIGRFANKIDAITARRAAELEHFGEFAPRHTAAITGG